MKKIFIFVPILALSLLMPLTSIKAAANLKGRILLQVESKGEAWYVDVKDGVRYYMADGDSALWVMKNLGVGISNKNLEKIKNNLNFRKKFIGQILLQVESRGEAYYIDFNGNIDYLKDGSSAYEIMKKTGLGVSNSDLSKIADNVNSLKKYTSSDYGFIFNDPSEGKFNYSAGVRGEVGYSGGPQTVDEAANVDVNNMSSYIVEDDKGMAIMKYNKTTVRSAKADGQDTRIVCWESGLCNIAITFPKPFLFTPNGEHFNFLIIGNSDIPARYIDQIISSFKFIE